MDNIFQNYASFISEQKTFFESNLSKDFHHNWDNDAWNIGTYGTGWLKGSGKGILTFDNISDRMKGIKSKIIINEKLVSEKTIIKQSLETFLLNFLGNLAITIFGGYLIYISEKIEL